MHRFTTTIIICALGLGFQLGHAASPEGVPSQVVRFGDLDLSQSSGAAVLYHRLERAAAMACAPLDDLLRHRYFEVCVQSAVRMAVAKVDRPALTAYYKAHTNGYGSTAQNPAR